MSDEHPAAEPQAQIEGVETKVPSPGSFDAAWEEAASMWIDNCVRNSPLSGNAEAWNHLHTVLPLLKQYLTEAMSKSQP